MLLLASTLWVKSIDMYACNQIAHSKFFWMILLLLSWGMAGVLLWYRCPSQPVVAWIRMDICIRMYNIWINYIIGQRVCIYFYLFIFAELSVQCLWTSKYFCCCSWTQQFSQSHQNQRWGVCTTPIPLFHYKTMAAESWVGSHQSMCDFDVSDCRSSILLSIM